MLDQSLNHVDNKKYKIRRFFIKNLHNYALENGVSQTSERDQLQFQAGFERESN